MRKIRANAAGALLMPWLLAACQGGGPPPVPEPSENAQTPIAPSTSPGPSPAATSTLSRSILRPDIVENQPAPPPLEAVEAVIRFDDRSNALSAAARKRLDALLKTPAMQGDGAIVLRGHTDSRGYDGDNLVTSRIRAMAVRDYLAAHGVDPGRITVIALGETRPVAPNATSEGQDYPEGRARNRRVEVRVEAGKGGGLTSPQGPPSASPTSPRSPSR